MITLGFSIIFRLAILIGSTLIIFVIAILLIPSGSVEDWFSSCLAKKKMSHILLSLMFGTFLIGYVSAAIMPVFWLVSAISVFPISLFILLLLSGKRIGRSLVLPSNVKVNFQYILMSIVFGSMFSFFIFAGIERVDGYMDLMSLKSSLKKSSKLKISNSFINGHRYVEEKVTITDKKIMSNFSELLGSERYRLSYCPGALAHKDFLYICFYKGEKKMGCFYILGRNIQIGSQSRKYESNVHLASSFRATIESIEEH